MTANLHLRILATLTRRYEQRIMNNVCRSDFGLNPTKVPIPP